MNRRVKKIIKGAVLAPLAAFAFVLRVCALVALGLWLTGSDIGASIGGVFGALSAVGAITAWADDT